MQRFPQFILILAALVAAILAVAAVGHLVGGYALVVVSLAAMALVTVLVLAMVRDLNRRIGGEPAELAATIEQVARGNLEVDSRGDSGIAASVVVMTATLKDVTRQAKAIARGDYSADIAPRSDRDELGIALQAMTAALRGAHQASTALDWLKSGLARLGESLRGDPGLDNLAAKAINEIATSLDAQVGVLYIARDDGTLALRGSYAYSRRKNLSSEFRPGEGLVGQAALEKQQILVRNVPEDYVRVTSGLGEAVPHFICVTPFLFENRVKGVVEIGLLGEPRPEHLEYLNQAMVQLAIAVESAQAQQLQARLLEESQRLTEELQVQQEELRTANEELEEQSQRLRESEARLKVQQEELEVSNKELEEKNGLLERQKREVEQARRAIAVKADELALASKYKSEFLSNMSHELRTPLNSLLLLAQSLEQNRDGNLSADQVESARVIHSSGSDLLSLINEILDLSKIEAGRMELQLGSVRPEELAEGLRASFAHMAQDKGLALEVTVDADVPAQLSGDGKRIEQVLRNLMSNALKFTESGWVRVHFSRPDAETDLSRSGLDPAASLAIAVSDSGIGIQADKHRLIFEAFQQADGGTSRRFGGTGLGLTISRELTSLMGGEIRLHSVPGHGATFTLYLPLAVVPGTRPPPVRVPAPMTAPRVATESQPPFLADDRDALAAGDQVILVIEDDPRFAAILMDKCHDKGFKCIAAASGEAGLELAARHQPHAVILDIRLPGMDGMAVLSILKEDIRTRHIPVHMVSVETHSTESLRRGAVGHAVKPIDQERLEGVFRRLEQTSARPRRVLVVEDDATVRARTVAQIADTDVCVDEAASGAAALAALRCEHYDCVVLDLSLPDMEGGALLQTLAGDGVDLPPVIIHTARDLTSGEERELREHAESIVIKDARSPERLLDEVSLFLHRVVHQMPEPKRRIISDLHDGDALLRGKKVLVVDDDMRTTFALSRLLTERGIEVLKAENGERALRLLDEQPGVDLVLMDIMMPVLDGYQTMQQLRAQERFRRLPIIALTAKAMQEDRLKCIEAGASDYLSKPIDTARLFSMMRVWLYG